MSIFDKLKVNKTGGLHAVSSPSLCTYKENIEHHPEEFPINVSEEYEYGFHFSTTFHCPPESLTTSYRKLSIY